MSILPRTIAVVGIAAIFATGAPAYASSITISGSAACRGGKPVVGIWIESSAEGSAWASYTTRTGASWIADFSKSITTATPTRIRLHIGCGKNSDGSWYSNNRTSYYENVTASKKVNTYCKESAGTGTRCKPWPRIALIGAPFTGTWNKWPDEENSGDPSRHHTSGNWSVDLYGTPHSSKVRASIFAPKNVVLQLKVAAIDSTCGRGETVRIDIYRSGTKIGYVSYGHLTDIPAAIRDAEGKDDFIANRSFLGYMHLWSWKTRCWEVETNEGVHTHFTAYNSANSAFACYAPYSAKKSLTAGIWIGSVGPDTRVTEKQHACPFP